MTLVVQQATAKFKCGTLELTWDCPFCGDHNTWGLGGLPPVVIFSGAIPCFCSGCRKNYALQVQQELTGVVTRQMKQ